MCKRLVFFPLQVIVTLVVILGLLFLFKDVIIERITAQALSSSLGMADSYALRITNTSVFSLLGGKVKEAWLTARGVRPKKGPAIDYMQVRARDIEFDTTRIKQVKDATFTATIIEEDLRNYIKTAAPQGIYPDVAMKKGGLVLKVRKDILGLSVPADVTGTLQVKKKHLLIFIPKKAQLLQLTVPQDMVTSLFEKLNPLLDTSTLKHPLEIDRLDMEDGSVTLKGRIHFVTPIVFRR